MGHLCTTNALPAGGVLAVLPADSLGRRCGTTLGCLLSSTCYVAVALASHKTK